VGKVTGFLEIQRKKAPARPIGERLGDWREVYLPYPEDDLKKQGARCMDCGIPFCHQGCPLGNLIPDWNDLVYRNRWP
jgi:glutamate synthase (NADPH) small chain